MKLRLQLLIESDTGEIVTTQDVAEWERHSLRPEDVGLKLAEAKQLLGSIQQAMVQAQAAECVDARSRCSSCGQVLARKGQHEIVFRTLFGELRLGSPRFYSCACRQAGKASFSPLAQQLPERTAPELVYFETKFGGTHVLRFNGGDLRRDSPDWRSTEYAKCAPPAIAFGATNGKRTWGRARGIH